MEHNATHHLDRYPITRHLNWFGVPRFWRKILIIAIIALLLEGAVVYAFTRVSLVSNNLCIGSASAECAIKAEVVESVQDIEKGLSNRAYLSKGQGMLFSFQNAGVHCFWMKDMHFPIDIIWLNTTKHIQHIEANVTPDSYPRNYCPAVDSKYVLEINAGEASKLGYEKGQRLSF